MGIIFSLSVWAFGGRGKGNAILQKQADGEIVLLDQEAVATLTYFLNKEVTSCNYF